MKNDKKYVHLCTGIQTDDAWHSVGSEKEWKNLVESKLIQFLSIICYRDTLLDRRYCFNARRD